MGRLRSGNLFPVLRTYSGIGLLASGYWHQAAGIRLLASGYWHQATGIRLLASGYWHQAAGIRLLAVSAPGGDLIQRIQNWQSPQRLAAGGLSSRGGDLIQDSRIQNWQSPAASSQKPVAISYWRSQLQGGI